MSLPSTESAYWSIKFFFHLHWFPVCFCSQFKVLLLLTFKAVWYCLGPPYLKDHLLPKEFVQLLWSSLEVLPQVLSPSDNQWKVVTGDNPRKEPRSHGSKIMESLLQEDLTVPFYQAKTSMFCLWFPHWFSLTFLIIYGSVFALIVLCFLIWFNIFIICQFRKHKWEKKQPGNILKKIKAQYWVIAALQGLGRGLPCHLLSYPFNWRCWQLNLGSYAPSLESWLLPIHKFQ